MMRIVAVAAVGVAALLASAASATVALGSNYTFNFSGACTDCTGTDTAQLVLTNYVLGSTVTTANFVSFHFDGSNLYRAFTIATPTYVSGSFSTTTSSPAQFFVSDSTNFFSSGTNGSWQLGNGNLVADYGTNGRFVAGSASSAPEPASWAMMLAGFGLIGAAARRRRISTRVTFA